LARKIYDRLGPESCALISQDNYYIDVRKLCPDGGLPNFDAPTSLEWSLLARHLKHLKSGHSVEIPTYDFTLHQRRKETESIQPSKVIIVEGILILNQKDIRAQLDHSVFIECSKDVRLERRARRDVEERGRLLDGVIAQFYETVEPSQAAWVDPSARFADRILAQEDYLRGGDSLVTELIEHWTGPK